MLLEPLMARTTPPLAPGLTLLSLALATSCSAHPFRPYAFDTSLAPGAATEAVAASLREAGLNPVVVDPRAGVIVTSWTDSGYRLHEAPVAPDTLEGDIQKYVFRRYHVSVLQDGQSRHPEVRLEAEIRRCLPPVTSLQDKLVGQCEDDRGGLPSLQQEIDQLGARLKAMALASNR
jgi:hypothetical protein